MKKFAIVFVTVLLALGLVGTPAQSAVKKTIVAGTTYDQFSMMLAKSAGQHSGGQWSWSPQSATKSLVAWGDPKKWPPTYQEEFEHVSDATGDWVKLNGWYDNGTFYRVQTTSEWQANADCKTGRKFLPVGGPERYARWTIPSTAYCMYAEATVTEMSSGKLIHFTHQQVWSPVAACPTPPAPVRDLNNVIRDPQPTWCINQWESYASDLNRPSGDIALQLERTAWLAQGFGMAEKIVQTFPLVNGQPWTSNMTYAWLWG